MKVLIVDDEQHVIDAIMLLVPWAQLNISEVLTAQTVERAIELVDENEPEVAIVDVVIGDTLGSDILKHINQRQLRTKVIIISGHDDYEYIRSMFVLGGVDYLLKPIEQEAIVLALKETIAKAAHSKPSPAPVPEQGWQLSMYRNALFHNLFKAEIRDAAYAELCADDPAIRQAKTMLLLYSDAAFLPLYQESYYKKLNCFLNEVARELAAKSCGILLHRASSVPQVEILLYGSFGASLKMISQGCAALNRGVSTPILFGCSAPCAFPHKISEALRQASLAFSSIKQEDNGALVAYCDGTKEPRTPIDIQLENRMVSAMLIGNEAQLDDALGKWAAFAARDAEGTRGELKCIWEYLFSLYEKWRSYLAIRYTDLECPPSPDTRLFAGAFNADWEHFLQNIVNVFRTYLWRMYLSKAKVQSSKSVMQEIADYLELNYAQEFHQPALSEFFHINKDYMSRKFKELYGVGMVNYVNRIRLRKAMELLIDSDRKVQEIAVAVGYYDEKYFSKLFKREANMSPIEYRLLYGGAAKNFNR
ncbi:MAG TPA: helix-turn-helix domain-containing protein [Clostridia bacterium]|nr:helix-turn-helix domain-containing protein [Clostridia bacterium]